jgi:hypothetical protein
MKKGTNRGSSQIKAFGHPPSILDLPSSTRAAAPRPSPPSNLDQMGVNPTESGHKFLIFFTPCPPAPEPCRADLSAKALATAEVRRRRIRYLRLLLLNLPESAFTCRDGAPRRRVRVHPWLKCRPKTTRRAAPSRRSLGEGGSRTKADHTQLAAPQRQSCQIVPNRGRRGQL